MHWTKIRFNTWTVGTSNWWTPSKPATSLAKEEAWGSQGLWFAQLLFMCGPGILQGLHGSGFLHLELPFQLCFSFPYCLYIRPAAGESSEHASSPPVLMSAIISFSVLGLLPCPPNFTQWTRRSSATPVNTRHPSSHSQTSPNVLYPCAVIETCLNGAPRKRLWNTQVVLNFWDCGCRTRPYQLRTEEKLVLDISARDVHLHPLSM